MATILIGWCVCLYAPSCLTLCDPMECSPPHGVLQVGILKWVAISSSRGCSQPMPFPPPGGVPNPGIERESPSLGGWFFTTELPGDTPALNHDLFLENKPVVSHLPLWLMYRILKNCVSVDYLTFCSLLNFLWSDFLYLPSKVIE